MTRIKIEEKYKSMDEISHVLSRSGMYVGSIKNESKDMFLYDIDESKICSRTVEYIPAMLKIVDEVISNSCDEYRRTKENLGLNKLEVNISKAKGEVTIKDNGGIAVVKHKDAGCYLPEFIFGQLRTSSNYNDDEDRNVIGTNGIGCKIANIFSKSFVVKTADGKNEIEVKWKNNMRDVVSHGNPTPSTSHYTKTTFSLDFSKFDTDDTTFTDDFISVIHKRCIDAAAANLGLKVIFKTDTDEYEYKFKRFKDYIELYSDFVDTGEVIEYTDDNKKIYIYPDGNINIGFVNGAECSQGTHIREIHRFVNDALIEYLNHKEKIQLTAKGVDNKYSVFCDVMVSNPTYDSQTKDCLTTPVERFYKDENTVFDIPEAVLKKVCKSEIVDIILDWYKQKVEAEDKAAIRKLNKAAGKKLFRSDKFINCNSRTVSEKELWIYEGDSAKSGFRVARNPQTQAAYIMRGVPLNSIGLSPVKVMANEVFADLVNVIGLKWGEYNHKEDLNFGRIVISSDADTDGAKIASLLLVFFDHFPELYEQGIVCRSISPIIIASKGTEKKNYYTLNDFEKDVKKLNSWKIKYCKGLGGLSDKETLEMMRNPIFHSFTKDEVSDHTIKHWFGKGNAAERRSGLKQDLQ